MKWLRMQRLLSPLQSSSIKSSSSLLIQRHTFASNSIPTKLTDQDFTKINLLIPRLCLSNNHSTAIHLTTTTVFINPPPPPTSLSLSILLYSLSSLPETTKPFSLLTLLSHYPSTYPHLSVIAFYLVNSYVKLNKPKEALMVYKWLVRKSPCEFDKRVYGVLVFGLCEFGWVFEGLKVVRDMVGVGLLPGVGLRNRVYRCLLRDARVLEAAEFNKAVSSCFEDGNVDGVNEVVEVLNSMVTNWKE